MKLPSLFRPIQLGLALPLLAVLCACSSSGSGSGSGGGTPTPTATYTLAGTVSGTMLQGVQVALSGAASATATTDASGAFTFTGLANGAYTLTPSMTGYTFTPASQSVTVAGANVTGVAFTDTASTPAGMTWTPRDSGIYTTGLGSIAYGNGTYVVTGGGSSSSSVYPPVLLTSPDGITWTNRASALAGFTSTGDFDLARVAFGNGTFVVAGTSYQSSNFVPFLLTSPDGMTWTQVPVSFQPSPNLAIGFVSFVDGQFILSTQYALSGTTNVDGTLLMTSPNGTTWTTRDAGFGSASTGPLLNSVAFGNGILVAAGNTLTTAYTSVSTDGGTTWTAHTLGPITTTDNVKVLFANSQFIQLGSLGSSLATSPDGVTWTSLPVSTNPSLPAYALDMAYGNGEYVLVGYQGGLGEVVASPDLIHWSYGNQALKTGNGSVVTALRAILYQNGQFVTVGDYGAILTSP